MSDVPQRILAVKLADIGDLLLITPALRALRATFPAATIDALVTPRGASAFHNLPLVDNLITFDKYPFDYPLQALRSGRWRELARLARQLRGRGYDTVIFFHHFSLGFGVLKHAALAWATGAKRRVGLDNGRGRFLTVRVPDAGFGARHELSYWLELAAAVGAPADREENSHWWWPELALTEMDRFVAGELLPATDRPTIALHPGSGGYSLARRWDLNNFVDLGRRLKDRMRLVVVGTPADGTSDLAAQLEGVIDLGGKTTVAQLAAVLARCDLLIGADSGVLHVASAVGTPTVALFGPTNHHAWAPALPAGRVSIIRAGSACSPCGYTHNGLGAPDGCPERTCMKLIAVEQVQAAAEALLGGHHAFTPPEPGPLPGRPPTVEILGVPLHKITFAGLLDRIGRMVDDGRKHGRAHQVATTNPEFVMAARRDPIFAVILQRAALCLPDGMGLLWAARLLGNPLLERVTGSDGVPLIAERAAQEGWKLFLLGAAAGVAERTAAILTERYPGLQVVGTHAGSPAAGEEDDIVELVNESQADILLVAYGAPRQDKWIARNLPRLQVGVAMGVGGTFDFISGQATRAPRWLQRLGLEWFHRLLREPWRWRRMLALPRFALAVMGEALRGRRRK